MCLCLSFAVSCLIKKPNPNLILFCLGHFNTVATLAGEKQTPMREVTWTYVKTQLVEPDEREWKYMDGPSP